MCTVYVNFTPTRENVIGCELQSHMVVSQPLGSRHAYISGGRYFVTHTWSCGLWNGIDISCSVGVSGPESLGIKPPPPYFCRLRYFSLKNFWSQMPGNAYLAL